MSLRWLKEEISTRYGAVTILTWAVPDPLIDPSTPHVQREWAEIDALIQRERKAFEPAEDQIGAVCWNSQSAAINYLRANYLNRAGPITATAATATATTKSPPDLTGYRIVELGSGAGVLGIALAMGGADAALSDLPSLVPLMRHNIAINQHHLTSATSSSSLSAAAKRSSQSTNKKQSSHAKSKPKSSKPADGAGGGGSGRCTGFDCAWGSPLSPALSDWIAGTGTGGGSSTKPSLSRSGGGGDGGADAIVLCDALYGNPIAWPGLVITLNEILDRCITATSTATAAATPPPPPVINFCEQRLERQVEPAFIELLTRTDPRWSCVGPTVIDERSSLSIPVRVTVMTRRTAVVSESNDANTTTCLEWIESVLGNKFIALYRTIICGYLFSPL